ncbi:MAG: phage tail protein [Desulfovibrionaceae bacterium]|nr:phage tail protein [Desulfovibrionaceae bacterium]MBF0513617.1 phage tail protein [Desulfovibrionaceae bacterium]
MADPRLIPPGIADASASAYAVLLDRQSALDPGATIVNLVDRAHPSVLPHLMEQFHVDFARPDLPDAQKRALIKNSIPWHKTKGTPGTLADMAEAVSGVRPEIREKNYFLVSHSALDTDAMHDAPRPAFVLGLSLADQDRLHQPGPNIFDFDVVFYREEAVAAGVNRADMLAVAKELRPARARAAVRFTAFALDHDYSRLDTDLIQV